MYLNKNYILIFLIFFFITKGHCQTILGPDTLICNGQYTTLTAPNAGAFKWSTGEETSSIRIYQSGTYWIEQGGKRDSIRITLYDEEYNQASNWALGNGNVIKFDTARPAHTASIATMPALPVLPAGNATAVDNDGHVRFFTDGESIFDTTGKVIETGFAGDKNISQNSLLIPVPGSAVNYYLYSIKNNILSYSTLKINKDKSITTVTKNIQLLTPVDEKLTAVQMGNGQGIWIMAHQQNSNIFKAFPFTSYGIGDPVTSIVGTPTTISEGYMKFSADGNRLAFASDFTEVFYFDNNSGKVIFTKHLFLASSYGVEFSPDGNFLYVTTKNNTKTDSAGPTTVGGSLLKIPMGGDYKTQVIYKGAAGITFGGIQVGPDKKIYVTQGNNKPNCLGVITKPDDWQPGSGYVANEQCFANNVGVGLPNWPQHYFTKSGNYGISNNYPCEGDSVIVKTTSRLANLPYANFSLLVDFNDPKSGTANFSNKQRAAHFYPVKDSVINFVVTTTDVCKTNKNYRTTLITPQPVANVMDTMLCPQSPWPIFKVDTFPSRIYTAYYWTLEKDTVSKKYNFQPSKPGFYKVKLILNGACQAIDSFNVSIKKFPDFSLGEDKNLCERDSVPLSAEIGLPDAKYLWNTNNKTKQIIVSKTGPYSVQIKDGGCQISDTVNITFFPRPAEPLFKKDSISCADKTVVYDAKNPDFNHIWNTGATTQIISVKDPGTYSVKIFNKGCEKNYTSSLSFYPSLTFGLNKEYILCETDKQVLQLNGGPGKDWLWTPGNEHSQSKTINKTGEYTVVKTDISTQCREEFKFVVKNYCEPKIFIPTAFTPNGDGDNELFKIFFTNIKAVEVNIFNRWGELIFKSANPEHFWDGTYKGQETPMDNYVYIINYSAENPSGNIETYVQKGSLVLIR